jgi:hypothetical protein
MNTFTTPSSVRGRIVRCLLSPVLMAAAVFFTSAVALRAATIAVNFAPAGFGFDLPSGTSAGVVPQTNWKNVTATTNSTTISSTIMNDNTGTPTTATFSVSGTSLGLGSVQTAAASTPGDERMMASNLSSNPTMTVSLANIPYAAYDLIIYNLPLFAGVKYTYTVGSTSYFGNSPSAGPTSAGYVDNNSGTPFTFTQATSTNTLSPTLNSTYARFDGLSGDINFIVTGGNGIAYLNGFQIIESVPEPSRAALLMTGLLALSARRSRRRNG